MGQVDRDVGQESGFREPANADPALAGAHLTRLQNAHRMLLLSIEEMLALAARPEFDAQAHEAARLRFTDASLARHSLFVVIRHQLLVRVDSKDAQRLEAMNCGDAELFRRSRVHFDRWRPSRLRTDWLAYGPRLCALCSCMLRQVDSEQSVLYQLLERQICDASETGRRPPAEQAGNDREPHRLGGAP
jgi:hypothetical protein